MFAAVAAADPRHVAVGWQQRARVWRFEPGRGKSLIVIEVIDQSHLHGVLACLQDRNIDIDRVNPV
jgi:hypothetical protein